MSLFRFVHIIIVCYVNIQMEFTGCQNWMLHVCVNVSSNDLRE